jgi:hypothetical protein
MSSECAVDLALISEASSRTLASGSARQSVPTRSKMSLRISRGRRHVTEPSGALGTKPRLFPCPSDDLPAEHTP